MRSIYFVLFLILYAYAKKAVSLNIINNLNKNVKKEVLNKKETSILRVCEITITMTHWTTHHECIVLSTVDPSKVTVNTENENTKYQMIEGTRSI